MFVASSRILGADGRAGMSSLVAEGGAGEHPCALAVRPVVSRIGAVRRQKQLRLSPEFTFSFCPGPSLLVQGCARDGRLAPPGICQTLCREEEAVLHDIKACATPRRGGDWRTPDARPV